jgi:hypothetical protein
MKKLKLFAEYLQAVGKRLPSFPDTHQDEAAVDMLNDLRAELMLAKEAIEELQMENRVHKKQLEFIMENVEAGNETTCRPLKQLYEEE